VARVRAELHAMGTQVAFVHMQSAEEASRWFERYGLAEVPRFSDPTHTFYRAFALEDGSLVALAHPRVWWRWVKAAIERGAGPQGAHWRQLTGVFLVRGDVVVDAIRHENSAARPDYIAFVQRALREGYNT
jgi:hypothetical protein